MGRSGLGDLERRVLMAIVRLRGQGYVVTIAEDMKVRLGKAVSLGAIYTTVDRLEKKGFISSRLGDPTPERGGKPKRFYQIEAQGQSALDEARHAERLLWAAPMPQGAI